MAFREITTVKLRWALIQSDWWQYKKTRLEGTHTHTGGKPCVDTGEDGHLQARRGASEETGHLDIKCLLSRV